MVLQCRKARRASRHTEMRSQWIYSDLPLCSCLLFTVFASYGKFVSESQCLDSGSGFVPSGFPCEARASAASTTAWLLNHPDAAFLIDSSRRCWACCSCACVCVFWMLYLICHGRTGSYGPRARMTFLAMVRLIPRFVHLATLLIDSQPTSTLIYTERSGVTWMTRSA